MSKLFIGREKEQQQLREYLSSDHSEFIAVYGRRRVGKTFLIQHVVGNGYAFYVAGMHHVPMSAQIENFMQGIGHVGKQSLPKSWFEAFVALQDYLLSLPEGRKIVFIDEMPWMDTPRSNFISGLEHFWNSWASWRDDIKLIVCGSATSWIINNLIKNRGGLHNRVTHKISLKPFTLKECQDYFGARGFRLSPRQIAEYYMVFGGVPFYLTKMNRGEGVAQNIDRLLFAEEGELRDEFSVLYHSLYKDATKHIKIVTALANRGMGLTRQQLLERTKMPDNGRFSMILDELESCGFIRCYDPFVSETAPRYHHRVTRHRPNSLYQLVDPFTLFHYQVMLKTDTRDESYWSNHQNTPVYNTWSGLAFEMLCLNHSEQIKKALGISGISSSVQSWIGRGTGHSVQIDMLIDRADHTVNLCEMKFYNKPYALTAKDEDDLEAKVATFLSATGTDKNVILTMITCKGLERNEHAEIVQKDLILDELFC